MKSNIMPIPFEKPKIVQTVIRTFDTHVHNNNNLYELNEKLKNGWLVVNITPMTHYIESILQKGVEE
jgi:hypothetical protein